MNEYPAKPKKLSPELAAQVRAVRVDAALRLLLGEAALWPLHADELFDVLDYQFGPDELRGAVARLIADGTLYRLSCQGIRSDVLAVSGLPIPDDALLPYLSPAQRFRAVQSRFGAQVSVSDLACIAQDPAGLARHLTRRGWLRPLDAERYEVVA